jgi:glycosyltransferase-like protein LARGE
MHYDRSLAATADGNKVLYRHVYDKWFAIEPNRLASRSRHEQREHSLTYADSSITIATQGTIDRVEMHLERLARLWQGPISIAVLIDSDGEWQRVEALQQSSTIVGRWVDFHRVTRHQHSKLDRDAFYPINLLRNVALQHVDSGWEFVLDLDVMPNACMKTYAQVIAALDEAVKRRDMVQQASSDAEPCPQLVAYVPPALELDRNHSTTVLQHMSAPLSTLPISQLCNRLSKAAALEHIRSGALQPMHMYYPPAYMPTDYRRWIASSTWYDISYTSHYEPYYIARSLLAPPFNESFVNRGGNFAQQVYHMWAGGFRFVASSSLFVIDIPHDQSKQVPFIADAEVIWDDFKDVVAEMYGVETLTSKHAELWELFWEEIAYIKSLKTKTRR